MYMYIHELMSSDERRASADNTFVREVYMCIDRVEPLMKDSANRVRNESCCHQKEYSGTSK